VYVLSVTEDFTESYITGGAAVYKETRFLKELVNTSGSVKLSGSEFMHISHTWSDNKVRKLATLCLLWQHWTKALVWFDDDISVLQLCCC